MEENTSHEGMRDIFLSSFFYTCLSTFGTHEDLYTSFIIITYDILLYLIIDLIQVVVMKAV